MNGELSLVVRENKMDWIFNPPAVVTRCEDGTWF